MVANDERTLIMTNAARLLGDAKLLADHNRFASAFALAVLGVEEIGKVILDIWGGRKVALKAEDTEVIPPSQAICRRIGVACVIRC
jgi:AbiV family abortive infection protein